MMPQNLLKPFYLIEHRWNILNNSVSNIIPMNAAAAVAANNASKDNKAEIMPFVSLMNGMNTAPIQKS